MMRRFRVASSMARLLRKLCPPAQIAEGYFTVEAKRESYVRVEEASCELVLIERGNGDDTVERTPVTVAQGTALLDVCQYKVVYERSRFPMRPNVVFIDRFRLPEQFDLISVEFETLDEASGFFPPVWFGPEVTDDENTKHRSIALNGTALVGDVEINNRSLNSLLDEIEIYVRRAGKP